MPSAAAAVGPTTGTKSSTTSSPTPRLKPGTRIEYLLSGSQQLKTRHTLPLDPKYIYYLYIGRRNAIKGFDIIIQAFEQAYRTDASLRLLLVGGGDPVRHPGIIDLGRSEEPGNWIAACDFFVSANRQSYFDLSVMEALSLGTPLIIASTGGHRFFADLNAPGITAIRAANPELLAQAMLQNRKKRGENRAATVSNQKIFDEQLASEHYRSRLDHLLRQLVTVPADAGS